ncbi:MAG: ABC transporter ATP-binding protein, partial [Alphaproteobacteria bacterium]|nr:ABC transporter ATP-binding protein [Alphaproteobacteria bacterium]
MAHIDLKNVTVDFPIYNGRNRSLKNHLLAFG